jgi:hypothetical protein
VETTSLQDPPVIVCVCVCLRCNSVLQDAKRKIQVPNNWAMHIASPLDSRGGILGHQFDWLILQKTLL